MSQYDLKSIKAQLKSEDIVFLLMTLGATRYEEKDAYIIFPTICHNLNAEEASMKLYYYKSTCSFHCYTECVESFDIFELYKKWYTLRNIGYNFYKDIVLKIISYFDDNYFLIATGESERWDGSRFYNKREEYNFTPLNKNLLSAFSDYQAVEWLQEGMSSEAMSKYNIKFDTVGNKIVIPHYDIHDNLIGIRGRALNIEDIQLGKYRPLSINGATYSHALGWNLYGLNLVQDNIKRKRYVIIFEGEKSCILSETYFGQDNVGVAVCGSNFSKNQLNLLLKYFEVNEIIIAFDKEYHDGVSARKYFKKLKDMCEKYNNYCNFSFIFDIDNLLDEKDSPIDKGKEIFMQLLNKRIQLG